MNLFYQNQLNISNQQDKRALSTESGRNEYFRTQLLLFFGLFICIIFTPRDLHSQNGKPHLIITELLANSGFSQANPDWVEVYNAGADSIDVSGMFWTDDLDNPYKFSIQPPYRDLGLIGPKQYQYFAFTKRQIDSTLVVPIRLNEKGDQLGLYSADSQLLDSLSFGIQYLNISYGRKDPSDSDFHFFNEPSPKAPNIAPALKSRIETPSVSHKDGYYDSSIEVSVKKANRKDKICYTLDGTVPEYNKCIKYTKPINISETSSFKVASFREGHLRSKVVNRLYLIREPHSLPVFSLTVADWDSFYVIRNPMYSDIEMKGHATFLGEDGGKVFSKYLGISLAGGASRRHSQKPISLHTRSDFGGKWMKYPMFPDKPIDQFRGFVLRNGGNSVPHFQFRDPLLQNIASELGTQDYLSSRPVVVYMNGEYYGVYNVREKKCRHYYEANHQCDGDSIDVLQDYFFHEKIGKKEEMVALTEFVEKNDLSVKANMDYVESQVDMENFIDYQILQIFYANTDWPMNNVRIWKSGEEGSKWRWMLFDLDLSFREYKIDLNSVEYALGINNFHSERETEEIYKGTLFLRKFTKENPAFKNRFLSRYADLLNSTLSSENIIAKIDSFKQLYLPEIQEHIDRWHDGENSETPNMAYWESGIENTIKFAQKRGDVIWNLLVDQWGLKEPVGLKITSTEDLAAAGEIKINSTNVKKQEWSGKYFQDFPVSVSVTANKGYKFMYWELVKGNVAGFDKKKKEMQLTFSGNESVELRAVFKKK